MPVTDEFWSNNKKAFGIAGKDHTYHGRSSCCPLGTFCRILRPGQLFYRKQNGEWDLGIYGNYVCSTCGEVTGQTQKCIAYTKQPNTTDTFHAMYVGNTSQYYIRDKVYVIEKGMIVNEQGSCLRWAGRFTDGNWKPWEGTTTQASKAKRLCECGAWAQGSADHTPAHSSYCPALDTTKKKQPETQEELVARVRAGRKGALVSP